MATGWKLRQIMADRKMTNEDLAAALRKATGRNTHWTTISRWKQADVMPKIDGIDLHGLLDALKCTRDELLGAETATVAPLAERQNPSSQSSDSDQLSTC
jgi:DNA-binding Xre family transcriptional regulator